MTSNLTTDAAQSQATPAAVQAQGHTKKSDSGSDDGLSFSDLLGVINPLQHIPIVSTIYRELTGDNISPAARIAGDALYGGLIGLGSSIVNEVVEGTTGKDIGGHIWATLFGDDDHATATAQAAPQLASTGSSTATSPALAPDAAANAAPAPAASTGPITPLNGPTSFYQGLQQGAHHFKGVPLSATVPTGTSNSPVNGAQALLQAQQPGGSLSNQAAQSAQLGTSGISASTSTPPPSLPGAAPTPNVATAPAVQGNIADKMMLGLDKYKALALQQDSNASPAPAPTDAKGATTALMN